MSIVHEVCVSHLNRQDISKITHIGIYCIYKSDNIKAPQSLLLYSGATFVDLCNIGMGAIFLCLKPILRALSCND